MHEMITSHLLILYCFLIRDAKMKLLIATINLGDSVQHLANSIYIILGRALPS